MVGRRDLIKRIGAGAAAAAGLAAGIGVGASADPNPAGTPQAAVKRALLVIDRSGSMNGPNGTIRKATIESVNQYLDEQRDIQDLLISVIEFDGLGHQVQITEVFDFTPAASTRCLTEADFIPRGDTPLRGALVEVVTRLEAIVGPDDRTLVVLQTDGHDSGSSTDISKESTLALVEAKKAQGWEFAFMGADIDAWGEGGRLGVAAGSTMSYANTADGTNAAYASASVGTRSWAVSGEGTQTGNFFNQNAAVEPIPNSAGGATVDQIHDALLRKHQPSAHSVEHRGRRSKEGVPHDCRVFDPNCFRCDLAAAESQ
jgi:uncharacterized protein YegL